MNLDFKAKLLHALMPFFHQALKIPFPDSIKLLLWHCAFFRTHQCQAQYWSTTLFIVKKKLPLVVKTCASTIHIAVSELFPLLCKDLLDICRWFSGILKCCDPIFNLW